MRELRFHRAVYAGEAVDAACKRLEGFGALSREATDTHWVIRVQTEHDERRLAGELANFALGLTVERGGA